MTTTSLWANYADGAATEIAAALQDGDNATALSHLHAAKAQLDCAIGALQDADDD